jgi:diguanylate cyclase (GGDEF)-like protein
MEELFCALVAAARRSSADVLRAIDRGIRRLEPAADATLYFAVEEDELRCLWASGSRAQALRGRSLCVGAANAASRAALVATPIEGIARAERLLHGDRRALAVPVIGAGCVRGVWYVGFLSTARFGSLDDLAAIVACGGEAHALALERERDRDAFTYDALTGVLTPRAFRSVLAERLTADRTRVLSLWFVDTDNFKHINDELGHTAGDAVLHGMAALLRSQAAPEIDVVGRKGGDEFCVLLDGTRKLRALERADAFTRAVRAAEFGVPFGVTASVGVAAFPFDASDAASLLEAADAAMYHAKRAGRDRVAYAVEGAGFALYEYGRQ